MDYEKHFLPDHIDQAKNEVDAIEYLLKIIKKQTEAGYIHLAKDRTSDMFISFERLITLAEIKEQAHER